MNTYAPASEELTIKATAMNAEMNVSQLSVVKTLDSTFFYHNSLIGTPKIMTNSKGAKVWKSDLAPYGEHFENEFGVGNLNAEATNSNLNINLRLPGQYADTETGFNYNYFRDYDPSLGRYLQSDPIGLEGGLNTYAYVGGNPVMFFDPFGLFQFGTRPLAGTPGSLALGNSNLGLLHENGFFDDGSDIGFFPEGIRPDDPNEIKNYVLDGPHYDDNRMREALKNLRDSKQWLPDNPSEKWYENTDPYDYDLILRNCQDFSDALRTEYNRLGGK